MIDGQEKYISQVKQSSNIPQNTKPQLQTLYNIVAIIVI